MNSSTNRSADGAVADGRPDPAPPAGFDTSPLALENFATGNPHYDCGKFGPEDALFLCYLAGDRDAISAEAALDRLRMLLLTQQIEPYLNHVYQAASLLRLGSGDVTVQAAAVELIAAMDRFGLVPQAPKNAQLTQTTGCPNRDRLLEKIIVDLDAVLGDRLLSCYAVGSAFDGSSVKSSDLDLHLLFKGAHSAFLKQAVRGLCDELSRKHCVDLDLVPFFESDIKPWADVRTKLGGMLIFGKCSSDMLVLPPIEEYVRDVMHRAFFYMARARRFPDSLSYPVSAPDTQDRFGGYNSRVHDDGAPSTKELVVVAGWLSTALVTRKALCYIASKSASYAGYLQHVKDEWVEHLRDVFELCRERWNYRLPETEEEVAKLEAICARQVGFENHFLQEYRKFLEEEVARADRVHAARACKLLAELFPDTCCSATARPKLLMPAWQLAPRRCQLDPRLVSVDHFVVKVPSLRELSDKALRDVFQRWDEFGVVIFACKDTMDLKYDLLGLQNYFGQLIFHPRSDKTGITSVRNLFKPKKGFAGTTNAMQTPHTDGSFRTCPPGIVALQTEICGLCGGESTLVFGDSLYRHLADKHAKDLEKLFQPNAYTIGRDAESCTRPVFWHEGGRVHMAYRCGNGEDLEVASWARLAFNRITQFVNAQENQVCFRLPTNHVLVVDNHRNLHGRRSWPPDTVRCLNRLWLDGLGTDPCYPGLGIRA